MSKGVKEITGQILIYDNNVLTTISGFTALQTVGGDFDINNNGIFNTGVNNVVTTITGFGSFIEPNGITGLIQVYGYSASKLLKFSPVAIKTNMEQASTKVADFTFTTTA